MSEKYAARVVYHSVKRGLRDVVVYKCVHNIHDDLDMNWREHADGEKYNFNWQEIGF